METILPKELKDQLNLTTLKVLKESYVDTDLSEYFSDLVFEVALNAKGQKHLDIVLLFEHKSAPDKNVLIQVGYYLFAHYQKCVVNKLPFKPVIPIIYYQGKKKWAVPSIADIFKSYPIDIKEYLPIINHVFVALQSLSNETLLEMKNTMMAVAMIAQKWRHDPVKLVEDIIKIFSLFQNELEDRNFLQQTFVYMLSASEVQPEDVKKIIESVPQPIKEDVMTTYAKIQQQERQIDIQKKTK